MKRCFLLALTTVSMAICETNPAPPAAADYDFTYVQSDQKWGAGLTHGSYNDVSYDAQKEIIQALEKKGLRDIPAGASCHVTFELLDVGAHSEFKTAGMDVSANISVKDLNNRLVYAKGYKGIYRFKAIGKRPGHQVHDAVTNLSKNIAEDSDLIKAVSSCHN